MGTNVPKDPLANPDEDESITAGNGKQGIIPDDTNPRDISKLLNQSSMSTGSLVQRSSRKKKKAAIVVFRNLFDEFLKMRYHFYAQLTNGDFAREPKDNTNVGLP